MRVTGAKLFTSLLRASGIEIVAGIPGHTVFKLANAIRDEPALRPLLVRHEAVASFAADVYFRVSGRMMAMFYHSIAGASNGAAGVANAYVDSSTMLVIAGESATDSLGRGAYQELSRSFDGDMVQWLRHISKRAWQPRSPYQLVEHTLRALKLGPAGRPGPVVLGVPQEVWDQEVDVPALPDPSGFIVRETARPSASSVNRAIDLLRRAERPLIVAGNGVNLARAQRELLAFAEQLEIPVATTVTGKGSFPEDHRLSTGIIGWLGTTCANALGRQADLIFAIGCRMTETTTGSWQPGATFALPGARLIQSDVEIAEIATVYPVDAALIGDAAEVLRDLMAAGGAQPVRSRWLHEFVEQRASWARIVDETTRDERAPLGVGRVVSAMRRVTAGAPATIVADIGKHHKWLAQTFEARAGDVVVSSMGAATMGFGPCGAVGAALARPDSKVFAWTGDGGISMVPFVLPTVAEYRLPIVYVVIDDGYYSSIAGAQRMKFGRTAYAEFDAGGTSKNFPLDLSKIAAASGIPARRVSDAGEIDRALEWALSVDGPALLDVVTSPTSFAPDGGVIKLWEIWDSPIHPWARETAQSTS